MTCAAAYRPRRRPDRRNQNSNYAVLAVDGRITDEHGTIYTDKAVKWAQAGRLSCVLAGDGPEMQNAIRRLLGASKRQVSSVRSAARLMASGASIESSLGWSALIYDAHAHELFVCDSDGSIYREDKKIAAIGTGAEVAIGHLLACEPEGPNWTEAQAKINIRGAVRSAAKRNSTVGPKATVLVVRQDGRVRVRG